MTASKSLADRLDPKEGTLEMSLWNWLDSCRSVVWPMSRDWWSLVGTLNAIRDLWRLRYENFLQGKKNLKMYNVSLQAMWPPLSILYIFP